MRGLTGRAVLNVLNRAQQTLPSVRPPLAEEAIAIITAWKCLTARAQRNMTTTRLICREKMPLARG